MADGASVKLKGEWSGFIRGLDAAKFRSALRREVELANERIARRAIRDVRRSIRAAVYAPNSPITVILKGSSKPLVDKGDLVQSVTFDQPTWNLARIGLIRARSGPRNVNLGAILHEGATIDTNKYPQVRRAVFAQLREALGPDRSLNKRQRGAVRRAAGKLASGGGGSTGGIWRIPARPFLATPLSDTSLATFARDTWSRAIERALP